MRNIEAQAVTAAISRLFQEANFFLPEDILNALKQGRKNEESSLAQQTLDSILENAKMAREEQLALCQDCGVAVVYLELGQDAHITGGDLYQAVNEGVRQAYDKGYLRKSMVNQPYSARINTKDNTPAVIHTDIVPGDKLKIIVMPKGGGSENMSRLFMLTPADGRQGVIDCVIRAVDEAGSNPCPPVIVGVGVGGTAEKAMALAKKALIRPIGEANTNAENAELEKERLRRVNALGIGPEGCGGRTTALDVHVETFPAHIASMPLAVNLQCHAARTKEAIL
ncbi:MAG: fumarate hydratase [Dehalococcoidales bacterium]|nr:fumarate hydratase [Dehalococcoidales bacterium]